MDQSSQHRRRQTDTNKQNTSVHADWVVPAENSVLTTSAPSMRPESEIITTLVTRTPTGFGGTKAAPVVVTVTSIGSATHVPATSPDLVAEGSSISSPAAITSRSSATQQISSATALPTDEGQGTAPQLYLIAGACGGVAFMLGVIGLSVFVWRRKKERQRKHRRNGEGAFAELSTDDGCALHEAATTLKRPQIQTNVRVELEGGWHGWEASPRSPKMHSFIFGDDCDEQYTGRRTSMMKTG